MLDDMDEDDTYDSSFHSILKKVIYLLLLIYLTLIVFCFTSS